VNAEVALRVAGRRPELWDAVTGERRDLPEWSVDEGRTRVPLEFAPRQSWFVVFRSAGKPAVAPRKNFPGTSTALTLDGEWEVTFDPKWGGPATARFSALSDWSKHIEPGIKFYSGRATYRKNFARPAGVLPGGRVWLDLGDVRDVAVVRLNGRDLGVRWIAPWRVDASFALREGTNSLEVEVINPWNNRLVGDAALPVTQRRTSLSLATVRANVSLLPAGLLGPVTLQVAESP
jgi:hypothetical protein